MAFDHTRPADMSWLGNNLGAITTNPVVAYSVVAPPVDSGTYPQPGQFAMPSVSPNPPAVDVTDPVLAAYLQAAKTPSGAGGGGGGGVAPPATSIAYQTSAGTASKPGVFIIIIILAALAFYFLRKKGAIHVG